MALDFKTNCDNCADCCNGKIFSDDAKFIYLKEGEAKTISEHLDLDEKEFVVDGWLKVGDNGDCVFKDHGCLIHEKKPSVCISFGQQYPCLFYPERSTKL